MEEISLKGYITFETKDYTFIYENKKLTLISIEEENHPFAKHINISCFEGYTIDGFNVVFFINDYAYYCNGCYVCIPSYILLSQIKTLNIKEERFNALKITGDTINRFYSNYHRVEFDPKEDNYLKVHEYKDSKSEEEVELNKNKTIFEFSIKGSGFTDDGIITIDNYDSLLKIKYNNERTFEEIIKDINTVVNFFKFCSNRYNVSFKDIFLESKEKENAVKIYIPCMINAVINKNMLTYESVGNKISPIINFLTDYNYIFSIITEDNKPFGSLSNKDYCATFSCFESIYGVIKNEKNSDILNDYDNKLKEIKDEIIEKITEMEQKYKGKDAKKRQFIMHFMTIVSNSNLRLEKSIANEFESNKYVIESLDKNIKDEINKYKIDNAIIHAVRDRDNITHNDMVKLDNISTGIYEIVYKLNYIMILSHANITQGVIEDAINNLSFKI